MSVNLSIKDVPEEIAAALRSRATRNHRSLQGELMAIIAQAAAEEPVVAMSGSPVTRFGPGERRGTKPIGEIHAEHRRLFPKPIGAAPLAVDIVRTDRDSR